MQTWQPIADAKQDGAYLCKGAPDWPDRVAIAWLHGGSWRWDVDDTNPMFGQPTHFMELPKA